MGISIKGLGVSLGRKAPVLKAGQCFDVLGIDWGNLGIMEKKLEATIVCWGSNSTGMMEKKLETTTL